MGFEQRIELRPQGGIAAAGPFQKSGALIRSRLLHRQPEKDSLETLVALVHLVHRVAAGTPAFTLQCVVFRQNPSAALDILLQFPKKP